MSGLKRRKPLAPGKPPARRGQLRRGTRVKKVNSERKAANYARNFGAEADAVRAMPCLCWVVWVTVGGKSCAGPIEPAHNPSRGAGGGRMDQTPLCKAHHDEQHAIGVESFEQRYGLDLRAEADRVAIGHASPLGIRGLAHRWAWWRLANLPSETGAAMEWWISFEAPPEPLDGYDIDALLGWVRREMAREAERSPRYEGYQVSLRPDDRAGLARHIADKLGGPFADGHGLAWALCDAAGWPGAGS